TVVSGGGGAFLHPTETRCGGIKAALKYPSERVSRWETAKALISPFTLVTAGLLWFVGIGLSMLFIGNWPDDAEDFAAGKQWGACVVMSIVVAGLSIFLAMQLSEGRKYRARGGRTPSTRKRPKRKAPRGNWS